MIRYDEGGPSYADVMGEARTSIPLEELGITDTRIRRAQTSVVFWWRSRERTLGQRWIPLQKDSIPSSRIERE